MRVQVQVDKYRQNVQRDIEELDIKIMKARAAVYQASKNSTEYHIAKSQLKDLVEVRAFLCGVRRYVNTYSKSLNERTK